MAAGSGTCSSISMQVTTSYWPVRAAASASAADHFVVRIAMRDFQSMCSIGDLQRLFGQVDALDARAQLRHRFGQDAAAAADVEHRLPFNAAMRVDPVQAQGIDLVQRLEFAARVPPAVGQFAEFCSSCGRHSWVNDTLIAFRCPSALHAVVAQIKKPRASGAFQRSGANLIERCGCPPLRFRRGGSWRGLRLVLLSAIGCFLPLPSV